MDSWPRLAVQSPVNMAGCGVVLFCDEGRSNDDDAELEIGSISQRRISG